MNKNTTVLIGLTAGFVLALSLADLAATKPVVVFGIVAPGGVFLFSIIFVVRDAIHKMAGAAYARKVIYVGAILNLLMALYFLGIAQLAAPPEFDLAEPWGMIFALAPGIVLASIVAAVVSQLLNTWVYQKLWERRLPQWARVILSNLVSLPVDSVFFVALAFVVFPPLFGAEPIPFGEFAARLISGQIIIKAGIMLLMTPIIYLIPTNPDLEAEVQGEKVAQ